MSNLTHTFPKLYKLTSTGAIQEWEISTLGNEIHTVYGQLNGKKQKTVDIIKAGKNIGKSNETSATEQAIAEAQSKWEKQTKKKYVQELSKAQAGESYLEGGYDPMLAHKFRDQGHKIVYPAFVQPKLDGHRCIAIIDDGVCTLWSRTRKPINSMPHIVKELQNVFPTGNHIIDGELYNHKFKTDFERITSLIRQETPDPDHKLVRYCVYDKAMEGGFRERYETLADSFHAYEKAKALLEHIEVVATDLVEDEDELMDSFENFVSMGYEGAMVRNSAGKYLSKRSYDLQKIKEFDDAEFNVIGVEEGRGKLMGHAAKFICLTKDGQEFRAKLKGDTSFLKELFEDKSLWDGAKATVKYQGLTNKGIPRFPVAERIRQDV